MQKRVYSGVSLRSLLLFSALWLSTAVVHGQPQTPPTAPNAVQTVLDHGVQLEIERRWGEAYTHYEDALRDYPDAANLKHRLEVAKIHYELGRRYSDKSFRQALVSLSERDSLGLYREILLKIQSHHVDEPNWTELVARGTRTMSVALSDEVFIAENLRTVPEAQVAAFRRDLEAQMGNFLIRTRDEARDAVAWAGRFAKQQLGMQAAPVIFEYLCGATNLLDPYSSFLSGDQLADVYAQIDGNFVGLGIELKAHDGALQILRVIPGSPAERGGIRAGDQIVAVDGHATSEMDTDQAANLLQGKEGTVVAVSVVSPGQQARQLQVRREHVEVPSVDEVKIVDEDLGIGYLRLTCFQKTTSRDLDAALWKLHRAGMRSLVMDLRGNPGGLLSASVEVVDKFVAQGTVVSTRGRNAQEDYTYTAHAAGTWRVPLVVLIDGDSASASEIFAGAIRDHRRGRIVGERSYGKGSVQGIFPLPTGGTGIRLTTAKFYSPQGHPFSGVGVSPDVQVQLAARPGDDGSLLRIVRPENDSVLNAGLREARNQMARR